MKQEMFVTPAIILIAEDNKFDRTILQRAFAAIGSSADLRFFSDGEDLVAFLSDAVEHTSEGFAPAIALLDLHMPRMNGRETLTRIRSDERLKALPIVMLTTSDKESHIKEMYSLGANSYLVKPSTFEELVATLGTLEEFWLKAVRIPRIA
jgi:two-component system response regulator